MKKLVIFGAGRIGRSFIAQLFSCAGYKIVFVDINRAIIDELNRRGTYNVCIKDKVESVIEVVNVSGVYGDNIDLIANELADCQVAAVSVGQNGLKAVMGSLAEGLQKRYNKYGYLPLDIIIAENLRNASQLFHTELKRLLPDDYPLDRLAGFVETSIGKMVPFMQSKALEEDILQVYAESYNTLILDRKAFKNSIPHVKGLAPKDNMKAWVDRKMFIHNLGHAALAYYSYCFDNKLVYTWQALRLTEIHVFARNTMVQAAEILAAEYPREFPPGELIEHIDDLLERFGNRHLQDTIYRVGCDLFRKLGPEDRIVGALRMAQRLNKPFDLILSVIVYACRFRATDDEGRMTAGDERFAKLYEKNIRSILIEVSGFDEENDRELITEIERMESVLL